MNTRGRLRSDVLGNNFLNLPSNVEQLAPSQPSRPNPLHDVPEVARRLNVSEKTVRRLIVRHELRAYRIGRQLRISEEELMRYLDARS
jgi:excisionase family DNA binding protein